MKVSISNCALCLCICTQLICCPAGLAQAADPGAQPPQSAGNLDLSSQERSFNAHLQDSVVIQVGSNNQTVNPNDLLTAAEFVAVRQVVKTGSQFIQLDALGTAVGGSFRITPGLLQHAESLLVPTGVTALYDAGKSANLNLAGNLTNAGQILTYSSNQAVNTATINTLNTFNQPGALISSHGNLANAYGVNNLVSQLSMIFNAVQNIVNAGQIVSSGNLSMTAGGQIVNALPANVTGQTPVMQAMQNVNLTANTIINSGTITSTLNNIQIVSQLMNDLNFINSGGLMSALAGSINFRDSNFNALANLSVTGGDLIAEQLNFHSGIGLVELNVNDLVGTVNVQACETHVNAATANLVLGNISLTGDPSFINTAGNVTLGSSMIFAGQSLSIIASGDVTTTASNLTIDTSSSSTSGGNILVVAGANLSSGGTTLTISPSALPTGGSASGGKIDFAASPLLTLTSRGLGAGTSNGGNITLVAFAGSGTNAGTISLPTGNALTIRSGGSNTGSNGNVTMIAGANRGTGNSISLGSINSTGGTNGTGQVTLSTSTPTISGGNILVDIASGAASGGTFTTGATQSASILANNITTTGANITVSSGANATVGALTLLGDRTPGLLNPTIQVEVNQVTDTATAFVVGGPSVCTNCAPSGMSASASSGGTNGNAGTVSIRNFGTGGIKVANAALLSVPVLTLNGMGGTILLDAAAGATAGTVDLAGGTYAVDGVGTGAGGTFDVRGSVLTNTSNTTAWTFSAKGGNSGGSGGQVALTTKANSGSLAFGTAVRQITALNVHSGTGGGDGGTVSLSAGQDLLIATSRINSRPQGVNGKGPTFDLKAGTAGAGLLQITGALNANGAGSGGGGTVNIEYRDVINPFAVGSTVSDSGISGSISADAPGSGAGGTISISNSASAPLAVALAGSLSATSATGPRGTLNFTHASSAVNVSGAGSLAGLVNAEGRSVAVSTGAGDLIAGAVSSTNGGVALSANAGNLLLTTNVAATGGDLALNSAPTGIVTVSVGSTATGESVSMQSGTVNVNGQVSSSSGSVSLQSNKADKSLNVLLASGSSISAVGMAGNLLFNQLASGAVSVAGGTLATSGSINLNGGNAAVTLSGDSIAGTINASGSSLSVNASTGNLSAGTISTTAGNVSLTAAGGNIALTGDVTALGGGLLFTTAPTGSITQSAGTFASADSVSISSSSVDLQGLLSAELGNVTVQSNQANHALSVTMAADSSISAFGPGANILFNSTNSGSISVSGGMLYASGALGLNGGANAVNLSVDSIYGTTNANGSTVDLTVASGQLVTGTVSSVSGDVALTATNGDLSLTGNVSALAGALLLTTGSSGSLTQSSGASASGDSVSIASGSLDLQGSVSANGSNLSLQSNRADHSLAVLLGTDSSITALSESAALQFNGTDGGAIAISGGALAASGAVDFNGGSESVQVSLDSLAGTTTANGSAVNITVATGNIVAGIVSSTAGDLALSAGSDLSLTASVTASGGALMLETGAGGSLSQASATTASGDTVIIKSAAVNLQGAVEATVGDLSVQSNAPDGTLNLSLSAATVLKAGPTASILLNSTAAGTVSVVGGSLSAAHAIRANGGDGTVSLSVTSAAGPINASGAVISIKVGSGDLSTGRVSSSAGDIALTASAGSIYLTDDVTATGGSLELTSSSNGTVNQIAGKSASGNSVSISSSSLLIDGSISATAGNVSTQSNAADRSLAVLLGAGASISSSANLTFNAAAPGQVSVAGGNGSLSAGTEVRLNGGNAAVEVNLAAISGRVTGNGTSISISTASGGLTISDTTATSGSIVVHSNGNTLNPLRIADNATLRATEGNVELVDTDSVAGAIVVGQGASISAVTTGTTLGRVNLAIGAVPAAPLAGTAPANVDLTLSNGGTVYWGNGVIASLPSNEVSSNGGRVVFSNGGPSAGLITLNGSVNISSTAVNDTPQPPMILIASLDFTDPSVVSMILNLQSQGKVGGTLQVAHGVAVGGNAIISSALLAPTLTAKNLPANVTLTMQDFDTSTPINISLTNQSSTRQVRINGTEQFVGLSSPSNAFISITSNQSEPVLVIGTTGSITSDGGLTISASGDIRISGPLAATTLAISTTTRNGDIRIDADITASSTLSLSAHGSGDIRVSGGLLSAPNISLASHTGSIGSTNRYVQTIAQNLSANTGGNGNVYIKDLVNANLLSSSAGRDFILKALGDLNLTGGLSAKTIEITADSTAAEITIASNLTADTKASLVTTGTGAIKNTAGTVTAEKLLLQSERGYIGTNAAPVRVAASELTAEAGGNVFLSAVGDIELGNSQAGGEFNLSSTGGITAKDILTLHGSIALIAGAGTLKIQNGSLLKANEGNILLQNTNLASGKIEVGNNAVIWAYTDCNPTLGNVTLSIGAVPSTPITGKIPSGVNVVSVAGGKVYFGTNGITAGKNVSLRALARDIVFSTGSRAASAIKLGNGVTLIADPPIPSAPSAISTISESAITDVQTRGTTFIPELPGAGTAPLISRDNLLPFSIQPSTHRSVANINHREALDTTGATICSPEALSKDSDLQQIAYLQPGTPSNAMMMNTTGALTERTLVGNHGRPAMIEETPGVFRLTEGERLLSASHPAVLKLSNCDVSIAAGTHVLLSHERTLVRIHNIYERSAHSIKVDLHNGQTLALSVGEEVMISESADSIQAALSESRIARRRTNTFRLQGGKTVCRSEASLITALQEHKLLRNLVSSSNDKDRAFTNKLVKMAACLMISTQAHGIYKSSK